MRVFVLAVFALAGAFTVVVLSGKREPGYGQVETPVTITATLSGKVVTSLPAHRSDFEDATTTSR